MDYCFVAFSENDFVNEDPLLVAGLALQNAVYQCTRGIVLELHPSLGDSVDLMEWIATWQERFNAELKKLYIIAGSARQMECLEFSHPDLNLCYFPTMDALQAAVPEVFAAAATPDVSPQEQFGLAQQTTPPVPGLPVAPSLPLAERQPAQPSSLDELLSPESDESPQAAGIAGPPTFPATSEPAQPLPVQPHQAEIFAPLILPDPPEMLVETPPIQQPSDSGSEPTGPDSIQVPPSQPQVSIDPAVPAEILRTGTIVELAGEYACSGCAHHRMYIKGDRLTVCENPECPDPRAGWQLTFELF